MADRKASEVAAKALKVVGKGIIDMAPDLVKAALGGTVVGVVAGYVATKVKEYVETKDEEKKKQIAKELNGSTELKELKEAAARGEFQPNQPHEYMSAVVFAVKDGDSLSKSEQDRLADALRGGDAGTERTREYIAGMAGEFEVADDMANMTINDDEHSSDCYIGDDYLSFNFSDFSEYNETYVKEIMGVLNEVVGRETFFDFLIYGYDDEF